MKIKLTLCQPLIFLLLTCSAHFAFAASPPAKVIFAGSSAQAINKDGVTRSITRGDNVLVGDRIESNTSRVQLRFSDGGYVAIRPESAFAIDEYEYEGKTDGNEKSLFSLLKGGMRAITGAVGRINKRNYRVKTSVATIGIRGTTFGLVLDNGLFAVVNDGSIVMQTNVGALDLLPGQTGFAANANSTPQPVSGGLPGDDASSPTSSADEAADSATKLGFIGGESVFQESAIGVASVKPIAQGVLTGSGSITIDDEVESGAFLAVGSRNDNDGLSELNASFNDNGGVVAIAGVNEDGETAALFSTNAVDAQSSGALYLGRWTDARLTLFASDGFSESAQIGQSDSVHYIVGVDEVIIPGSGTATYSFSNIATPSTGTDGSIGGGITNGSVAVDFGSNYVTTDFTVSHGTTLDVHTSGVIKGAEFETNGFASGTGDCSVGCNASADGFFTGAGSVPQQVGLGYKISTPAADIVGVGGFGFQTTTISSDLSE